MKRGLSILMFVVSFVCAPSICLAQASADTRVTIDLKDVDSTSRDRILSTIKEKEREKSEAAAAAAKKAETEITTLDPAKIQSWANIGKELGSALSEMCKAINVGVNDFIKTPVGIIASGVLIWKLIGASVAGMIKSLIIVFLFEPIVIWSFFYFHGTEKVEGKDGPYRIERYKWIDSTAQCWSVTIHVAIFVILLVIAIW